MHKALKELHLQRKGHQSQSHTSHEVMLFVGCWMSQQQASVSQGQICSDKVTCCHTEIEVADQTFHLTHAQYTDTRSTSPSTDPITPGRVTTGMPISKSLVWLDPKKSLRELDSNSGSSAFEADALTTRPMRRSWSNNYDEALKPQLSISKYLVVSFWCYMVQFVRVWTTDKWFVLTNMLCLQRHYNIVQICTN